MSVYKSRRKDAAAEFIQRVRVLRETTLRILKKFPKNYRYIITNNMINLVTEAYTDCIRANDIYLHKDANPNDYELRHRYLVKAKTSIDALLSEMTFLYNMVEGGENFLHKNKDKIFENWSKAALSANEFVKAIINSDNQRWANYQQKRKKKAEEGN